MKGTSTVSAAAEQLRRLNERQVRDGIDRLRAELTEMREEGILDPDGRRIGDAPSDEILDQTYDV
jgi:hypothetical protein